MPKELSTTINGTITERWTIQNYTVVPPSTDPAFDGSVTISFTKDTLLNGDVKVHEVGGDFADGNSFQAIWDDVATRMEALVASGVSYRDAYHLATREALYAFMQRADGTIPVDAQ